MNGKIGDKDFILDGSSPIVAVVLNNAGEDTGLKVFRFDVSSGWLQLGSTLRAEPKMNVLEVSLSGKTNDLSVAFTQNRPGNPYSELVLKHWDGNLWKSSTKEPFAVDVRCPNTITTELSHFVSWLRSNKMGSTVWTLKYDR